MQWIILAAVVAAGIGLILWNRARSKKAHANPTPATATPPTPAQLEQMRQLGITWEEFKARNGIKGP